MKNFPEKIQLAETELMENTRQFSIKSKQSYNISCNCTDQLGILKNKFIFFEMEIIPIVDVAKISGQWDRSSDEDLASVAKELFKALSGIGFAYITNHGISKADINNAFSASKTFFELPETVKDKSSKDLKKSYNNGYSKPGQELLKHNSNYEIRETYDFCGNGRFYPEACPEFRPALHTLEEACQPLVKNLLRALAISLELDDLEFFVTRHTNLDDVNVSNYTVFRSAYYPPIPDNILPGTLRCAEHTDYGMLTLLFQDSMGGLQVKSVSGKWVDATPIPGTILLNTGHLLEIWSGGIFPATFHRVLTPETEAKMNMYRQSFAYFIIPDNNTFVTPLAGKVDGYEGVFADEYTKKMLALSYAKYLKNGKNLA